MRPIEMLPSLSAILYSTCRLLLTGMPHLHLHLVVDSQSREDGTMMLSSRIKLPAKNQRTNLSMIFVSLSCALQSQVGADALFQCARSFVSFLPTFCYLRLINTFPSDRKFLSYALSFQAHIPKADCASDSRYVR